MLYGMRLLEQGQREQFIILKTRYDPGVGKPTPDCFSTGISESHVLCIWWKIYRSLSHVQLFATLWTVAHQSPPSMGFSRQEYRSWLPFPSPGDLPDSGIEPRSPALQADALTSKPPGKPKVKWSYSVVTLCDPMDCSLPGSSVHGIFQAIVLEWIAISFSRASSRPRDRTQVSHIVDRHFTIWATREVILVSVTDLLLISVS